MSSIPNAVATVDGPDPLPNLPPSTGAGREELPRRHAWGTTASCLTVQAYVLLSGPPVTTKFGVLA